MRKIERQPSNLSDAVVRLLVISGIVVSTTIATGLMAACVGSAVDGTRTGLTDVQVNLDAMFHPENDVVEHIITLRELLHSEQVPLELTLSYDNDEYQHDVIIAALDPTRWDAAQPGLKGRPDVKRVFAIFTGELGRDSLISGNQTTAISMPPRIESVVAYYLVIDPNGFTYQAADATTDNDSSEADLLPWYLAGPYSSIPGPAGAFQHKIKVSLTTDQADHPIKIQLPHGLFGTHGF